MREAFEAYIVRHSPIDPVADGRWLQDDRSQPTPEFEAAVRRSGSAAQP
jgi:hypothetical protein